MVISSLIIQCKPGNEKKIIEETAGVAGLELATFVDGQVVFTLESRSFKDARQVLESELKELPGVLGVYPVYFQEIEEAAL